MTTASQNIFSRHRDCRCTVTYECGRQRQDVWSKRKWEAPEEVTQKKPTIFTQEEAEKLQAEKLRGKGLTKGEWDDILKTENPLPDYQNAIIPERKFTEYALNPARDPDKARAFQEALGYNTNNYEKLVQNIRENLPYSESVEKGHNGYGTRYEVVMYLKGVNGKTAKVLTGWIHDDANGEMRLTTVHID